MATETTLKTVERALRVLEIIAAGSAPLQVREVAEQLGHNITSTYHMVNTLIASGYVTKNDAGRLSIGRKIGLLHSAYVRNSDFGETVRPLITALAEESGETVYLTRLVGDASMIEMVVESTRSLRVTGLNVGYSGLEDRRASGKAVLAHLTPVQLDAAFAQLHPELAGDKRRVALTALVAQLDVVREHGYAFDDEEFEEGVCCVAVPYFGAGGRVAGAIAASAPALRLRGLKDEVRPLVLATAQKVTEFASAMA